MTAAIDATDRAIINALQGGFPLTSRPYEMAGAAIGVSESELIARIETLLANGTLSRFGPLWNVEEMGGAHCLCAMTVPSDRFDRVAALVNAHPEVAHNYERDHAFNMWFVLSTVRPEGIAEVAGAIEAETGLTVHRMSKTREFFVGLRVEV